MAGLCHVIKKWCAYLDVMVSHSPYNTTLETPVPQGSPDVSLLTTASSLHIDETGRCPWRHCVWGHPPSSQWQRRELACAAVGRDVIHHDVIAHRKLRGSDLFVALSTWSHAIRLGTHGLKSFHNNIYYKRPHISRGLHLIMHRTFGLKGYIGPLTLTIVR